MVSKRCRWLNLQAAPERAIQLHHGHPLLQAQLRKRQLPDKQLPLRIQYLQIAVQPAPIAQFRQAHRILQRSHQQFLLMPLLSQLDDTLPGASDWHLLVHTALEDFTEHLPGGPPEYRAEVHDFALRLYEQRIGEARNQALELMRVHCTKKHAAAVRGLAGKPAITPDAQLALAELAAKLDSVPDREAAAKVPPAGK